MTKRPFKRANKFMTLFSFLISHISFISSIDSNFVSSSEPKDIKSHYALILCGFGGVCVCVGGLSQNQTSYSDWQRVNDVVG